MTDSPIEYGVFHIFCGSGGGALGFQSATAEWRGLRGRFRTLGGVDADPDACADFESLTGVRATQLDLFSRADYTAFHGKEPADWREATAADLRVAAGGERPDVVFGSPPCKAFSALLPKAQAESAKYAALNRLSLRGVALALEAWEDDPPGLFILENVPRIASRGKPLLDRIKYLLGAYGYHVHEGIHDVGEVGGLAQHRRRYLLVARHPARVTAFLYQAPKRRVRAIGSVLGELPMPDDPAGGPMHRLPRLNWLTWVRLALIPAGGDWRDLQGIEPGSYAIEPVRCPHFNHVLSVTDWSGPAGAVTGGTGPMQGAASVADPRVGTTGRNFKGSPGLMGVRGWDQPSTAVTGSAQVSGSNMPAAVADPRIPSDNPGRHQNKYRVQSFEEPAATVTGSDRVGSGAPVVADPRIPKRPERHSGDLAVRGWADAAQTVTGEDSVGSGAQSVADPRLPDAPGRYPNKYGVQDWSTPAKTVTGMTDVQEGAPVVADPPLTCTPHNGAYGVVPWGSPSPTVTASGDVHAQGAAAVADPRLPGNSESGAWVIVAEDGTWHRPLTTLELAALQGFPTVMRDGSPLTLAGKSQARFRERIGNAVPPPAARAVGDMMLQALIPSSVGAWAFSAMGTAVWVRAWWRVVVEAQRSARRPAFDSWAGGSR